MRSAASISWDPLWGVGFVLALIAVIWPILDPVFDHHFAERMPDHGHLYYGRPDFDHEHAYEIPHVEVSDLVEERAQSSTVIILPMNSATKDGPAVTAAHRYTVVDSEIALIPPALSPLIPVPERRPGAVFLAPPDTPPRANT